jgi:hypothetical protein
VPGASYYNLVDTSKNNTVVAGPVYGTSYNLTGLYPNSPIHLALEACNIYGSSIGPTTQFTTVPYTGSSNTTCTPTLVYCPCSNTAGNSLNSWVSVSAYMAGCGITFSNFQDYSDSTGYDNSYITATNPVNGLSHIVYGWTCSDGHMYKDTGTLQSILGYLLG